MDKGARETDFRPVPVSEFLNAGQGDEPVDWILDGYSPASGLMVFAGKPKEGKTTLS
ncbi:MAG: AAA family ATPase [Nitrospira sp.]